MKGGPVAAQLASEVQPTFPFFSGAENRYLESWNLFWTVNALGPSVGNNNAMQLRNPAGSNVIAIIEQLRFQDSLANQVYTVSLIRAPQADLTNISVVTGRDSRGVPSVAGGATMVVSTFAGIASFATVVQQYGSGTANTDVDSIFTQNQEWLVLPGDTYRITTSVVNSTTRLNLKWRERFLEDSERT
jgi:hypothetical protein